MKELAQSSTVVSTGAGTQMQAARAGICAGSPSCPAANAGDRQHRWMSEILLQPHLTGPTLQFPNPEEDLLVAKGGGSELRAKGL